MTSILADRQYTLIDFNKIKQKYYNKEDNSLDNSTIDLINEISLKVGAREDLAKADKAVLT